MKHFLLLALCATLASCGQSNERKYKCKTPDNVSHIRNGDIGFTIGDTTTIYVNDDIVKCVITDTL